MTKKRKRRSRRLFQFSLRTLLIAVFLISLPLSWFAAKLERAKRQRRAVEAIEELGGEVHYRHETEFDAELNHYFKKPAPAWARRLLMDGFFDDVIGVSLVYPEVGDSDMEELKNCWLRLPDLEAVDLSETKVTDAGIRHLKGISRPRVLVLNDTQITDAGLEHLQDMTRLQQLWLGGTGITDEGLEHLQGLSRLKKLNLESTRVTPEGVEKLQKALPECEIVY